MDYSDTCRSVYRSRNQWLHAGRWLRAARILTAISSCLVYPTRLRPAHNRDCPTISADGLSLRQLRGRPRVAKRRWHGPQWHSAHGQAAFSAFRGTDWRKEPCTSCLRRLEDYAGCRCQALALTGDARETDPVCHLPAASGPTAPQRLKTLWWGVRSTSSRHFFPKMKIARLTNLSPRVSALASLLLVSLWGLHVVSRWLTPKLGESACSSQ